MATMLKMQLNTPATVTRDTTVDVVNAVTGERRQVKPFLDGTVSLTGLVAGEYEIQVRHPNFLADLFRRRIRLFPDRPTFIPVAIPPSLFENTPIADTPDADLGPVQARMDAAAEASDRQARKRAGQPIYADDWNELAGVVADVARGSKELATLVAPVGHDHPELVAKLDEQAQNLQRLFDVFGEAVAQLQREVQILGLNDRVNEALDALPVDIALRFRPRFQALLRQLDAARVESPQTFTTRLQRIGTDLAALVDEATRDLSPDVATAPPVRALTEASVAYQAMPRAPTYLEELAGQNRVNRVAALNKRTILR